VLTGPLLAALRRVLLLRVLAVAGQRQLLRALRRTERRRGALLGLVPVRRTLRRVVLTRLVLRLVRLVLGHELYFVGRT
jgi:hypothetical protein